MFESRPSYTSAMVSGPCCMLSSSCCLHHAVFIPIAILYLLYTYRYYIPIADYIPTAIIYLSLHCHHHSDSCIKMGSDESHFNVRDKVTRQCPQATTCLIRRDSRSGIEPRPFCLSA